MVGAQEPDDQLELGFLAAFERAQQRLAASGHTLSASEAHLLNMTLALMNAFHTLVSQTVIMPASEREKLNAFIEQALQNAEEIAALWFPNQS